MNQIKEQAINLIKLMPDKGISLEAVMEEIYFKMQVDHGLAEIEKGLGVSHEKAKKRMSKWLKD